MIITGALAGESRDGLTGNVKVELELSCLQIAFRTLPKVPLKQQKFRGEKPLRLDTEGRFRIEINNA